MKQTQKIREIKIAERIAKEEKEIREIKTAEEEEIQEREEREVRQRKIKLRAEGIEPEF